MTKPDTDTIAAWTRLATASRVLINAIEEALKSHGFPPLAWYDALLELDKAGEAGLRPFELRARLLLPQYGTSRLLDRMAREDLVEKRDCPDDGRGQIIRITSKGAALRTSMWPVYADALIRHVETRLDPADRRDLARILDRLLPPPGT